MIDETINMKKFNSLDIQTECFCVFLNIVYIGQPKNGAL